MPFLGSGEKRTISTEGGNEPVWSRNGRELFYRSGDTMMAVDVTTSPGKPRRLFARPYEVSSALWADYGSGRSERAPVIDTTALRLAPGDAARIPHALPPGG